MHALSIKRSRTLDSIWKRLIGVQKKSRVLGVQLEKPTELPGWTSSMPAISKQPLAVQETPPELSCGLSGECR